MAASLLELSILVGIVNKWGFSKGIRQGLRNLIPTIRHLDEGLKKMKRA
jgi:hypothetical protein